MLAAAFVLVGCTSGCASHPASPAAPPSSTGGDGNGSGDVGGVTQAAPPPAPAPAPGDGPKNPPPPATPPAGVVSFVNVTSDKVADVSSLEAWKQSFIRADMSDDEKAQAIWRSVVAFRHQDEPPRELIEWGAHPHDPIKLFNVYGYSQCDCS